MAVDQLIKQGDDSVSKKDYLTGISYYTKALNENPKAFQAYLKRSIAYQRFKNFDRAKFDVSEAFTIAEERGRRGEIAECYYRLGIIYYSEKDFEPSLLNFQKADEYGCKEPALQSWILKCKKDTKKDDTQSVKENINEEITKEPIVQDKKDEAKVVATEDTIPVDNKSTSLGEISKHAPLKVKIREDWYQTTDDVIITIYAKNIKKEDFSIEYGDRSVSVSFPSGPGSEYNYNLDPLFASIDSEKSSFRVFGTKIEIYLVKKEKFQWKSLEGSDEPDTVVRPNKSEENNGGLTYPTSSKKSINWANFKIDDDDEGEKNENEFFSQLFKDTDEDSRRAMMKSYVQSNGTVLTTNWDEAKDKTFDTSPPEGMEAKKW
ncbi:protein Sgt1p [[Candida] jaroonii]|uniref:Protein Sgt1p n=1 Tax=[Candida] jaroonii TaxID=467808 RepID=A0ACA9YA89_9ASCO|nr:protein Sgt1p [[Candida] jaroonii]